MKRSRGVKVVARKSQRVQIIRERRRGPSETQLKAPELNRAPLDLSRETYLTVAEAAQYLRFADALALRDKAARRRACTAVYMWAQRHGIPKCRRGLRTVLFLRRDLDEAVQAEQGQELLRRHA